MAVEEFSGNCLVSSSYWGSPAEANGNMVAILLGDVLHILVPEFLQDDYPREQFLQDLGQVKFVQCAFALGGDRALQISFEDGSDGPYSIGFEPHHLLVANRPRVTGFETGWLQIHLGPDIFSPIIEYRMIAYPVKRLGPGMVLPEPPPMTIGSTRISSANLERLRLFVEDFFQRCGDDFYDFEEFLADFYRRFKSEWEHLKFDLWEPWNQGAEQVGRPFLKVTQQQADELVRLPRIDLSDYM